MAFLEAVLPSTLMMVLLFLLTNAKVYKKCELAGSLLARGVRGRDIPRWVCIAFEESGFDSNRIAVHTSVDAQDHGLWQINDPLWVGRDKPGGLCGFSGPQVRGENLDNAVECVKKILYRIEHDGHDKWLYWTTYALFGRCQGDLSSLLSNCFST